MGAKQAERYIITHDLVYVLPLCMNPARSTCDRRIKKRVLVLAVRHPRLNAGRGEIHGGNYVTSTKEKLQRRAFGGYEIISSFSSVLAVAIRRGSAESEVPRAAKIFFLEKD